NITDDREISVIAIIERHGIRAINCHEKDMKIILTALTSLSDINRDAMAKADNRAKRFFTAGAWVAVFFGFFNFMLSMIVFERFRYHIIIPISELYQVLMSVRQGEFRRRCQPKDAPDELKRIMENVNLLLDQTNRSKNE
ncbi:MAG: hypothetical protein HQK77_14475, partial [Desulfobacterales bacterium]|nr:hypothetical protein [Desulfobacterales bacterium]